MPRARRNLVDGGYYHVLTRGNNRRELFKEDQDHRVFLSLIDKYLSHFHISIFHYCLMLNHVHLLLQLSLASELPKFMQGILQSYAMYFRKKYDSVGFIFQNRYKSIYIHSEAYLLEAARYIERNPLRAQMTDDLDLYPWSSFHHYASGTADKIIRNTHPSYFELGKNPDECLSRYREFVRIERPYDTIVDEVYKMV